MNPAVPSPQLPQTVHVGGLQLAQLAVAQQGFDAGMIGHQVLQHLGGGGIGPVLVLLLGGKAQLVEQHLAQLLGAVQVEVRHLRQPVHRLTAFFDLPGEKVAELVQGVQVHQKTFVLHLK